VPSSLPQSQGVPAPTVSGERSTPPSSSLVGVPSAQPLSLVPGVPPFEPPVPHIEQQHCLRVSPAKPRGQTPPLEQQHCLLPDSLGALVQQATHSFATVSSWQNFFLFCRDQSDISTQVSHLHQSQSSPPPSGALTKPHAPNWRPSIDNHPSMVPSAHSTSTSPRAHKLAHDHVDFLRDVYMDMIRKGHRTVLPASLAIKLPHLRLSPLGVVPQRERRPRTISDYSFYGVNAETAALAPFESMQFGRTLHRLLQQISMANPRFDPVYMSKLDIADGFYRIPLRVEDIPKLGVVFPKCPGEVQLVAFPLTLHMGWVYSPPFFTAATETVADLANASINCSPQPLTVSPVPKATISACTDVPARRPPTNHAAKTCGPRRICGRLHLAHPRRSQTSPRRPTQPLPHTGQGISPIRGWRQFTSSRTHLFQKASKRRHALGDYENYPWLGCQHRKHDHYLATAQAGLLHDLLDMFPPTRTRISVKEWQKFLGELRSISLAIPGARGLFSVLQEAFRQSIDSSPIIAGLPTTYKAGPPELPKLYLTRLSVWARATLPVQEWEEYNLSRSPLAPCSQSCGGHLSPSLSRTCWSATPTPQGQSPTVTSS
jgi:hypothetical protein